MRRNFDLLDYQIIHTLTNDGRRSATEIAKALNANERTIRKRIDRLVDLGAIRFTAIVNPGVFGYVTAVDIFLEIDPKEEDDVLKQFTEMSEISYIAFGQGSRDISIEGRFKDNDEMHEFLRKTLPGISGVKVKGYTLVPRIIRNIDEWIPRKSDFVE